MKRKFRTITGLLLAVLALGASGAAPAPDAPLIVDGSIVVDAADFEGSMLRIPENRRAEFRTNYDRVAGMADNLFIARTLAARAKQAGLDKDVIVQRRLQQVQDQLLAELYVQKLEKEAKFGDLDQRARELYKAEQSKLIKPEEVYVQQILIGIKGRTREMAHEIADKVSADAASGKEDFLKLAQQYSDDPDKRRNGGDLGYNNPVSFIEPVRNAIAKMSKKDEVSQPVESEFGFHIIRFIDRKPPHQMTFEEVRQKIIDLEKDRLQKVRLDNLVKEIRGSKTVVVHRENVEALVTAPPPDAEMTKGKPAEAPKK